MSHRRLDPVADAVRAMGTTSTGTAPIPVAYRVAAAILGPLPPGCGQHPLVARLLRRSPVPRGTFATKRMRSGARMVLDLGTPQEATAWLLGNYEPGTVAFLSARLPRGGVFLDVGANVGLISLALAATHRDADVYCFEADPATASRLEQNARAQANHRVLVVHAAVSDTSGQLPISGESTMLTRIVSDGGTMVPALRLDDYVAEQGLTRIDLVKIDVEGHELQVLRGSERLIERFRPTFVLEAAGRGDDNAVARFLLERGYRLRPIPPVGLQRLRPAADLDRNLAFLPAER